MKLFRSFIAPVNLRDDEYVFTLDHDGGLVVSLEVLQASGALDSQLQGVRILKELEKKRRGEGAVLNGAFTHHLA